MRTLTPAVLASLMAIVCPPVQGNIEYRGNYLLVSTGMRQPPLAAFDLEKLCVLVLDYMGFPSVGNQTCASSGSATGTRS